MLSRKAGWRKFGSSGPTIDCLLRQRARASAPSNSEIQIPRTEACYRDSQKEAAPKSAARAVIDRFESEIHSQKRLHEAKTILNSAAARRFRSLFCMVPKIRRILPYVANQDN